MSGKSKPTSPETKSGVEGYDDVISAVRGLYDKHAADIESHENAQKRHKEEILQKEKELQETAAANVDLIATIDRQRETFEAEKQTLDKKVANLDEKYLKSQTCLKTSNFNRRVAEQARLDVEVTSQALREQLVASWSGDSAIEVEARHQSHIKSLREEMSKQTEDLMAQKDKDIAILEDLNAALKELIAEQKRKIEAKETLIKSEVKLISNQIKMIIAHRELNSKQEECISKLQKELDDLKATHAECCPPKTEDQARLDVAKHDNKSAEPENTSSTRFEAPMPSKSKMHLMSGAHTEFKCQSGAFEWALSHRGSRSRSGWSFERSAAEIQIVLKGRFSPFPNHDSFLMKEVENLHRKIADFRVRRLLISYETIQTFVDEMDHQPDELQSFLEARMIEAMFRCISNDGYLWGDNLHALVETWCTKHKSGNSRSVLIRAYHHWFLELLYKQKPRNTLPDIIMARTDCAHINRDIEVNTHRGRCFVDEVSSGVNAKPARRLFSSPFLDHPHGVLIDGDMVYMFEPKERTYDGPSRTFTFHKRAGRDGQLHRPSPFTISPESQSCCGLECNPLREKTPTSVSEASASIS